MSITQERLAPDAPEFNPRHLARLAQEALVTALMRPDSDSLREFGDEWMDDAACHGMPTALFFPAEDRRGIPDDAKLACRACPVRNACLQFALDHPELKGYWGGTTTAARDEMRRDAGMAVNTLEKDRRCSECGAPVKGRQLTCSRACGRQRHNARRNTRRTNTRRT